LLAKCAVWLAAEMMKLERGSMMSRGPVAVVCLLLAVAIAAWARMPWVERALSQSFPETPAAAFSGAPVNRGTINSSAVIISGSTFQTVLAAQNAVRQELTIANNNATDSCWVFLGSGAATKGTSILLLAGASYRREWPFVPSDAVQATCASTSDTVYIDTQ
jgi:hypothetical protein